MDGFVDESIRILWPIQMETLLPVIYKILTKQ